MGNLSEKRVMVRVGIPPSVSTAKVRSVMRKAGLKWNHAQKKGVQTKSGLNLRLKFAQTVRQKLPKGFSTESVRFYLDGTSFTHKMNPFDQARASRVMV